MRIVPWSDQFRLMLRGKRKAWREFLSPLTNQPD
jgi:hypothetical protein